MQHTEEWWNRMFMMYAKLVEDFDEETFLEFKENLYSIPYAYAKPREGLGIGAQYINEIADWNIFVYKVSLNSQNGNDAWKALDRALDYFCDPTLNYDDKTIEEAKALMRELEDNCIIGIYEGCHDIYDI